MFGTSFKNALLGSSGSHLLETAISETMGFQHSDLRLRSDLILTRGSSDLWKCIPYQIEDASSNQYENANASVRRTMAVWSKLNTGPSEPHNVE